MHYGWHRSESKHSAALAAVALEMLLILFMPRPARLVTEEALVNPAVMKASSDPGALKFISEVKAQWRGEGGGGMSSGGCGGGKDLWSPCRRRQVERVISGPSFLPAIAHVGGKIKPPHQQKCLGGGGPRSLGAESMIPVS